MAEATDTLEGEVWKPVPGYEGSYEVSNLGRVRALPRWVNSKNGSFALKRMKIMSGSPNGKTGYPEVKLAKNGSSRGHSVHRLVCLAFHGPAPDGRDQVAHCDGTRTNNRADNLRWASAKENADDRIAHGTERMGVNTSWVKLTEDDVRAIRASYVKKYGALARLARQYGVTSTQILHIVQRKHWKHID